jgi:hypothetical protein
LFVEGELGMIIEPKEIHLTAFSQSQGIPSFQEPI